MILQLTPITPAVMVFHNFRPAARDQVADWTNDARNERLRCRCARRLAGLSAAAEPGWSPLISFDNE
jgi:hypothetical protein